MALSFGGYSRVVFGVLAMLPIAALFRLYHLSRSDAVLRAGALLLAVVLWREDGKRRAAA